MSASGLGRLPLGQHLLSATAGFESSSPAGPSAAAAAAVARPPFTAGSLGLIGPSTAPHPQWRQPGAASPSTGLVPSPAASAGPLPMPLDPTEADTRMSSTAGGKAA